MRPHPLYILYDVKRWLWLWLIPLVRLVLTPDASTEILTSSLRDFLLAGCLLTYACWKRNTTYYQLGSPLQIRKGIVIRRQYTLPSDSTSLVTVETTPLMRLCRCRRVQISTISRRRQADATLYLSYRQAWSLIRQEVGAEGYHARTLPILIMALSGSNAAIGAVTLVPFIRRAATVLGNRFPTDIYSVTEQFMVFDLPPVLQNIANLLLLGWCVSVINSLFRTHGFRVHRYHRRLHILSGVFTKRSQQMDVDGISSLLLRQTLFTRVWGLYTATIACAGYGRESGVRPLLIPAATMRDLCRALDHILPGFPIGQITLRPSVRSLPRYILPPILLIAGASVLYFFSNTITAIPMMLLLVIGLWWFAVRLLGFFYSGCGMQNGAVVMRYPRGLALYELHMPVQSIDRCSLRQGPLGRRRGKCTLRLLCFGEKHHAHRVWGLDKAAVENMIAQQL